MKLFDSIVIGAGPAGMSAAIYLARYNRTCLAIDIGTGRSTSHEINENYLGFPKGIHIEELRELGREQAERFGVEFVQDKVTTINRKDSVFHLRGGKNDFLSQSVVIATGVTDLWPEFENMYDYLGRTLFWCITCDGHKTIGKKVVIAGDTDDAACTALQFLNFTDKVSLVTNQDHSKHRILHKWRTRLEKAHIEVIEGRILRAHGREGRFHFIELDTGKKVELDYMFNQQGAVPNSELAKELGVATNEFGYIKTDHEMKTNIPMIYAAGDVTRLHSHQVVIAAAEGATAGETANYDLYRPEQKWN